MTGTAPKGNTNCTLIQVALLAEILKAAPVNSNDLFRIMQDLRVQPRWEDIALPVGKQVLQIQNALPLMICHLSCILNLNPIL
ncbi:hypothetical protein EV356DRAFT_505720 [Viridothelium virens]|uniref:Uncharacterized protein n=1 Tax=Viridothelium virens TaxID=1048519 RepID=A0A6A6H2A4_VIRVR|nr:hypothetical protein EV356DRAFT_505720 [Viridothelium virens]